MRDVARVLLVMRTRTYRAKAFLGAARKLGIDVTVATEREQPIASLRLGASLALEFDDVAAAQRQARDFAKQFPVKAVVGVDDDTTVLAAQIANTARDHGNPFSGQQRAFQPFVSAVAAKTAARGNHAMARDIRSVTSAHHVADCPSRPRTARQPGDAVTWRALSPSAACVARRACG